MNNNLNACDKCGTRDHFEQMIWITADSFTPEEGEYVNAEAYEKYDCLCADCYKSVLVKNPLEYFAPEMLEALLRLADKDVSPSHAIINLGGSDAFTDFLMDAYNERTK